MDYFFENANVGNHDHLIDNNFQTIFENHGLQQYAEQFVPRITELARDYRENVSKYGTLYQLAIPKQIVHKNVISVKSGGFIKHLSVYGESTTDMQKIATALLTPNYVQPSDKKEYVLLMTQDPDGGGNPESGIRVAPHMIAHSKEALDAWKKEWDATLQELATAVLNDQQEFPVEQYRTNLKALQKNKQLKTLALAPLLAPTSPRLWRTRETSPANPALATIKNRLKTQNKQME
jgi:hypothetical protein